MEASEIGWPDVVPVAGCSALFTVRKALGAAAGRLPSLAAAKVGRSVHREGREGPWFERLSQQLPLVAPRTRCVVSAAAPGGAGSGTACTPAYGRVAVGRTRASKFGGGLIMSSMRSEHDTGRFCPGSRWGFCCDVDQVLFMLSMFIGGGTAAPEV